MLFYLLCMNIIHNGMTQNEFVILTDFPLQQWLHEHATVLRYTYSSCFVMYSLSNFL